MRQPPTPARGRRADRGDERRRGGCRDWARSRGRPAGSRAEQSPLAPPLLQWRWEALELWVSWVMMKTVPTKISVPAKPGMMNREISMVSAMVPNVSFRMTMRRKRTDRIRPGLRRGDPAPALAGDEAQHRRRCRWRAGPRASIRRFTPHQRDQPTGRGGAEIGAEHNPDRLWQVEEARN